MSTKKTSQHKSKQKKDPFDNIDQELSKFEVFYQNNQKYIWAVIIGLVLIITLIWGYRKYILIPKEREAISQMSVAEQYFDADSFKVALNGVDQYPGFLDIIQSYKGTKAANLAQYYAGVCYAHLQQWNQAISHLKKFKTDDIYLGSTKYGLMGDCYMQMNKVQKAVEAYKKSVEHYQNHLTTPIYLKKLGLIYESLHQWKKALDAYNQIYLKYPTSYEARTIEKYIERVKLHMGQQ